MNTATQMITGKRFFLFGTEYSCITVRQVAKDMALALSINIYLIINKCDITKLTYVVYSEYHWVLSFKFMLDTSSTLLQLGV